MSEPPPQRRPTLSVVVVLRGDGGQMEFHLTEPAEVCRRVGEDILGAFLRLFVAVDRLSTFEDLRGLLLEVGEVETPRAYRRFHVLSLLLASTMYELGDALQKLCNARVVEKMADRSVWEPLNELRRQWHHHPLAKNVRHQAGHHLGDAETYRLGIQKLTTENEIVLYATSAAERHGGAYVGAWQALMLGTGIPESEWREFVRSTWASPGHVGDLVMSCFKEVLTTAGIEIEGLPKDGP